MDTTFPLTKLFEYGALGMLTAFMFYFYRADRKAAEAAIIELTKDFKEAMQSLISAVDRLAEERGRRG